MKLSTRWIGGKKGLEITLKDFDTTIKTTIFDIQEVSQLLSDAEDLISDLRYFMEELK
jgi:hypothetical protein